MSKGPYSLVVSFTHGAVKVLASGHDPQEVRRAESSVARNPQVIARIELCDLTGTLETIWSSDWEKLGGINP